MHGEGVGSPKKKNKDTCKLDRGLPRLSMQVLKISFSSVLLSEALLQLCRYGGEGYHLSPLGWGQKSILLGQVSADATD